MDGMSSPPGSRLSLDEHLPAIYVHAGAGFHSFTNERAHLNACADASKVAMNCLRSGGSALDAVELAIKSLEDNEVTNAGYGSNLTVHGQVEGDATIVDHLGRSGAVGAIGRVTNPIHVARLVYDRSTQPIVLKRVPPNLLVGDGAVDFARENGITTMPNKCLISQGAQERYERWQEDIRAAEASASPSYASTTQGPEEFSLELTDEEQRMVNDFGPAASRNPIMAALANESQPFTPPAVLEDSRRNLGDRAASGFSVNGSVRGRSISRSPAPNGPVDSIFELNSLPRLDAVGELSPSIKMPTPPERDPALQASQFELTAFDDVPHRLETILENGQHGLALQNSDPFGEPPQYGTAFGRPPREELNSGEDTDMISDTVGAIAVDQWGKIAAASSSGGIGMKHKGRVGPAALVGIGTAVIPLDADDQDQTIVACVTSGTGEHMATSLAASTCAQRLYIPVGLDARGMQVDCDDEQAMKSFVIKDFMGHPSVVNSTTGGAIGAMAVKKDRDGMWLYFAHNTNSFALASMHAYDKEPHTVMSRSNKQGKVTTGGRSMRARPVASSPSVPFPGSPSSVSSPATSATSDDQVVG